MLGRHRVFGSVGNRNAKTFVLAVIRSAKMKVFAGNAIAGELNIIYYFSAFSKKSRT